MEIGVPKENKDQEFRVGLSPSSVRVLRCRFKPFKCAGAARKWS